MQTLIKKNDWEIILEANKGCDSKPLFVVFANDDQSDLIATLVAAVEALEGSESVIVRASAETTEAECMTLLHESHGADAGNSIVAWKNGEKVDTFSLDAANFSAEAFNNFVQQWKSEETKDC